MRGLEWAIDADDLQQLIELTSYTLGECGSA
jgi:hypothetical protein